MDGDSGSVDEVLAVQAWLPVFGSLEPTQNPAAVAQASRGSPLMGDER